MTSFKLKFDFVLTSIVLFVVSIFVQGILSSCVVKRSQIFQDESLSQSQSLSAADVIAAYKEADDKKWTEIVYIPFLQHSLSWLETAPEAQIIDKETISNTALVLTSLNDQRKKLQLYSENPIWNAAVNEFNRDGSAMSQE